MAKSPLYDIFDPDGSLAAQAEMMGKDPTLEDLMPEDERKSRLRDLANMGANGIAGLGWILDTPGAVVRGLLSGGPGKAASALWDTTDDRVTGRELLRQYGMAGKKDSWGNFFGGLASEVLLDPSSWIGLGLLGQVGKTTSYRLAEKAGLLEGADVLARKAGVGRRQFLRESTPRSLLEAAPDALRESKAQQLKLLVDQEANRAPSMLERVFGQTKRPTPDELMAMPVARTNRVSVLGKDIGAFDLYGKEAGDWMAKKFDDLGESAKQAPVIGPAYRTAQALLDNDVDRKIGYEDQWNNRIAAFERRMTDKALRGSLQPHLQAANEAQRQAAKTWASDYATRRAAIESQAEALRQSISAGLSPDDLRSQQAQLAQAMSDLEVLDRINAAGGPIQVNSPEYTAAWRHAITTSHLGRLPSLSDPSAIGPLTREDFLRDARLAAAQDLFDPSRPEYADSAHKRLIDWTNKVKEQAPDRAIELGIPLNEFNSKAGTGWLPRQQLWFENPAQPEWPAGVKPPTPREQKRVAGGLGESPLGDAYSKGRSEAMDVFGGEATLDRMSMDAELQAALRAATDEQVPEILEGWFKRHFPDWIKSAPNAGMENPTSYLYPWFDDVDPKTGEFVYGMRNAAEPAPGSRMAQLLADQESLRGKLTDLKSKSFYDKRIAERKKWIEEVPLVLHKNILLPKLAGWNRSIKTATEGLAQRALLEDSLLKIADQMEQAARASQVAPLQVQLANVLRRLDPQHAQLQTPMFGQHIVNDMLGYASSRGRVHANARTLLDKLANVSEPRLAGVVPGGANYTWEEVADKLGFDKNTFVDAFNRRTNGTLDARQVSFPKVDVDNWARALAPPQSYSELDGATRLFDNFTKRFKTLALLSPARWVRDNNSGAFAAAMRGLWNPFDRYAGEAASRGNYAPLASRLEGRLGYEGLSPEDRVRKFLRGAAEEDMTTTGVTSELSPGAPGAGMREIYPGSTARPGVADSWMDYLFKNLLVGKDVPLTQRLNLLSLRTADGNVNPLLEFGDRVSNFTDARNRLGTYLTAVRTGHHPSEARRLSDLTQVNYRPEAFSSFERDVLKRMIPFYSYQKGITPLIIDEALNRPAGVMGQSVRLMTRGSEPSEEFFVPEYLRQSSSIPLHANFPLIGLGPDSKLQRFITNVDLPFEGVVNLFTPGTGNNPLERLASTAYKTGQNFLGMTHPLIKGPLELATNRQFYSGRQLSDLYSILENTTGMPAGRWLEHLAVNAPGGSKALGLLRQITDDRLTPREKLGKYLFKTATGLTVTDVDLERTRRLAARNMLNDLLQKTPGVRTYENITVPEEQLRLMPEDQQRMYLLYKIIQTQAAKQARERKKQQLQDPMAMLGIGG